MTTTPTPVPNSQEPPQPVLKMWKPTTAGILTIIAGALNVILGIVLAAVGAAFSWYTLGIGAAIGRSQLTFEY